MAAEKDFELLDDYLSNRLSEGEREAFERKLEGDPELSNEFQFQKGLIDGVRQARAVELKSMLSNIPIASVPVSQSVLVTKVAVSLIVAGIVGTAIYLYVTEPKSESPTPVQQEEVNEPGGTALPDSSSELKSTVPAEPGETRPVNEIPPKSETQRTEELSAETQRERELVKIVSRTFVTSSTEVVVERGDHNHHFHYAFKNKKLVLYGSFEKNQYQILEFITADEHVFFLNYKSSYYLLDEKNDSPTQLHPIHDSLLLSKLREFRAK